jgi:hypothetical protein
VVRFRSASSLLFGWTVLDLLFNVRYPALAPAWLAFLPSLDATILLGAIAIIAWRGRRLPRAVVGGLALAVMIVRAFRVGDGIVLRYFNRPFDLGLDLPTAGEIGRLMRSTVSPPVLTATVVALVGCTFVLAGLAVLSIRAAERALATSGGRSIFVGVVLVGLLTSPLLPADRRGDGLRQGVFAPSVAPRLLDEGRRLLRLGDDRRAQAARVRDAAAHIASLPRDLGRLGGRNVLLFFVESYGAVVLEHPEMVDRMEAVYHDVQTRLGGAGFQIASRLIDSPTYGGRSQLAHQAFFTGVRAGNRIDDDAVQALRPRTMADVFRDAGYRTVLVMPGTTHRNLSRWVYDFDRLYAAWDLDYRGPTYAFGAMPDQFVIDAVHRREIAGAHAPLLIAYALISSHAPWNSQPPLLTDWAQIGDGRPFASFPAARFGTDWINLREGAIAYTHAIAYDLQTIAAYLTGFDLGDALVIVLGDHQPVADVTRGSASSAVPIHIISRRAELVAAFRTRGYTDGMRPAAGGSPPGMETFLPDLLADFSTRSWPSK